MSRFTDILDHEITIIVQLICSIVGALWILHKLYSVLVGFYRHAVSRSYDMYQRYGRDTAQNGSKDKTPKNKSWVGITGATGAIGFSYCKAYARRGFNILMIARNAEKIENSKEKLIKLFPNVKVSHVLCDLANLSDIDSIQNLNQQIDDLINKDGIDVGILINNAGILEVGTKFTDVSIDRNIRVISVNCEAVVILCSIFLKYFEIRNKKYNCKSCIINISSASGFVNSLSGWSIYGATKSFLIYFSQSINQEFKNDNIDIICLAPMFVASDMTSLESNRRDVISSDTFVETSMKHIGKVSLNSGYWFHALLMSFGNKLPNWLRHIIGKNVMLPIMLRQEEKFPHSNSPQSLPIIDALYKSRQQPKIKPFSLDQV